MSPLLRVERFVAPATYHPAVGASPAPPAASSPWPIPSVLIQRCWPRVSPTKKPSSTSSGSVKCRCSRSQSSSSARLASQMIVLAYDSAVFSRSLNLSEARKSSSSS
jgi:hypothetical protein